jgi:hypothetical protein
MHMPNRKRRPVEPGEHTRAFYVRTLKVLNDTQVPFLVGGAFALARYTGVERDTKDFDLFVRREDYDRLMETLALAGCQTELTFPHWLGKATCEHGLVDVIFSSGNGVALVDEDWFEHAVPGSILGTPVLLCPAEEMIWSKAFINERERYDGADVMHLLLACAEGLDWTRLVERFGSHWRVLLSYLCLFGFVYPFARERIPGWVMSGLMGRLEHEMRSPPPTDRVCQGTLLSREQYLTDVGQWGYMDARLLTNAMTHDEIEHWTRAIDKKV